MRKKGGLTVVGRLVPEVLPPGLFDEVIRPEDIGYTHPIFLQCFMPQRHNVKNQEVWQTNCGRASLLMRAGVLVNPQRPNTFKKCAVPAGPKARIINAYTNDFICRNQTPVVPLGDSMRQAMNRMNVQIGGANGKELQRELENFAAAEMIIGVWEANGNAHQHRAPVSETMSFWIEKNPDQQSFWQPEMTVSPQYYKAVTERDMAPFHWTALIGLQHNPRAMDLHAFLTYRMHKGLPRPVTLHVEVLHAMFGQGIKQRKHFWAEFKIALAEAHKWYPQCRVEVLNDGIKLHDSPPLIPPRKIGRIK